MKKYNAIQQIEQEFTDRGVYFQVDEHDGIQEIQAGFSIDSGPNALIRFICTGNDNAVSVRVFGIVNHVPEEKVNRVLQACNVLNCKIRALKFYIDKDSDLNAAYDFPLEAHDESIGPIAFEIFIRLMHVIKNEYGIFMEAIYTDNSLWDWTSLLDQIALISETPDGMEHGSRLGERRGSLLPS